MADKSQQNAEIIVNKEFAMASPGFAIDAGGSVTKLIYRDKEDYSINETGDKRKLRLTCFDHDDYDGVLKFISERCYLSENGDQTVLAFHTGNNLQQLRTSLDKTFNTQTVLQSENDAMAKGYINLLRHVSTPHHEVSMAICKRVLTQLQQVINMDKELTLVPGTLYHQPRGINESVAQLTPETLAHLCNTSAVQFPCLLICFGSATFAIEVFETGKYKLNVFTTNGGKTYLNLSRYMTNAKTFDELMVLCASGCSQNVDMIGRDLHTASRTDSSNWSHSIPTDLPLSALGKLASAEDQAKFTRDDVAAGVLRLHCQTLAEIAVANAYISGIKSIVMAGSFLREPIAIETMYSELLRITMTKHYQGNYLITSHITKNPGFLVALGSWAYDVQQKRDT